MDRFLLHLSHVLENFTAVIFTDKSTYRLPSAPEKFHEIARAKLLTDSQPSPKMRTRVGHLILGAQAAKATTEGTDLTIQGEKARKETQRILQQGGQR